MTDTCETCRFYAEFKTWDAGLCCVNSEKLEAVLKTMTCRKHQPRQEGGEG